MGLQCNQLQLEQQKALQVRTEMPCLALWGEVWLLHLSKEKHNKSN